MADPHGASAAAGAAASSAAASASGGPSGQLPPDPVRVVDLQLISGEVVCDPLRLDDTVHEARRKAAEALLLDVQEVTLACPIRGELTQDDALLGGSILPPLRRLTLQVMFEAKVEMRMLSGQMVGEPLRITDTVRMAREKAAEFLRVALRRVSLVCPVRGPLTEDTDRLAEAEYFPGQPVITLNVLCEGTDPAELYLRLGRNLSTGGDQAGALEKCKIALEVCREDRVTGFAIRTVEAEVLSTMASISRKNGDLADAFRQYSEALAVYEVLKGSDQWMALDSGWILLNLGIVWGLLIENGLDVPEDESLTKFGYDKWTDYEYYEKAWQIYEHHHKEDSPMAAWLLRNRGVSYLRVRKLAEARADFSRAQKIYEALGTTSVENYGELRKSQGMLHLEEENYQEAAICFEDARKVFLQVMGMRHGLINTMRSLQDFYQQREDMVSAEEVVQKEMALQGKLFSKEKEKVLRIHKMRSQMSELGSPGGGPRLAISQTFSTSKTPDLEAAGGEEAGSQLQPAATVPALATSAVASQEVEAEAPADPVEATEGPGFSHCGLGCCFPTLRVSRMVLGEDLTVSVALGVEGHLPELDVGWEVVAEEADIAQYTDGKTYEVEVAVFDPENEAIRQEDKKAFTWSHDRKMKELKFWFDAMNFAALELVKLQIRQDDDKELGTWNLWRPPRLAGEASQLAHPLLPVAALCVGNDDYQGFSLQTAVSDAEQMHAKLLDMGFLGEEVTLETNVSLDTFTRCCHKFVEDVEVKIQEWTTTTPQPLFLAFFYFAGCVTMGSQGDGVLMWPVDVPFGRDAWQAVNLHRTLLRELVRIRVPRPARLVCVICIDYCSKRLVKSVQAYLNATRPVDADLPADVDQAMPMFCHPEVLFACAGSPEHWVIKEPSGSAFTRSLLRHLDARDEEFQQTLKAVRDQVFRETKRRQCPCVVDDALPFKFTKRVVQAGRERLALAKAEAKAKAKAPAGLEEAAEGGRADSPGWRVHFEVVDGTATVSTSNGKVRITVPEGAVDEKRLQQFDILQLDAAKVEELERSAPAGDRCSDIYKMSPSGSFEEPILLRMQVDQSHGSRAGCGCSGGIRIMRLQDGASEWKVVSHCWADDEGYICAWIPGFSYCTLGCCFPTLRVARLVAGGDLKVSVVLTVEDQLPPLAEGYEEVETQSGVSRFTDTTTYQIKLTVYDPKNERLTQEEPRELEWSHWMKTAELKVHFDALDFGASSDKVMLRIRQDDKKLVDWSLWRPPPRQSAAASADASAVTSGPAPPAPPPPPAQTPPMLPVAALCVGNNNYEGKDALHFAASDAEQVRDKLVEMGFLSEETTLETNASLDTFKRSCHNFVQNVKAKIKEWSTTTPCPFWLAFLFYAGHGTFQGDRVRMWPVDVPFGKDARQAVDLQCALLHELVRIQVPRAGRFVCVLCLDCCRNNPKAQTSVQSYLNACHPAEEEQVDGQKLPIHCRPEILISWACSHERYAIEGMSGGVYTRALLQHLDAREEDFRQTLQAVREQVWRETNHLQKPSVYDETLSFRFTTSVVQAGRDRLALAKAKAKAKAAPQPPAPVQP